MKQAGTRVWDLPTRLFHWALVALVALQFATGEFDWLSMQWHYRFGYATLALLLFRVAWGFAGSQTSRFADFLHGPANLRRYLRALATGRATPTVGHNALGGWSIVVVLVLLIVQTLSGLFSSDAIDNDGPFADAVPTSTVKWMTRIHHFGETALIAWIVLHLLALLLHWLVRRDDLVTPMLTGRRRDDFAPPRFASGARAALLFAIAALAVIALSRFGD
ncbi:MAG: cytochrome b/b6 domain-containing protein [Rudaea sp.]